jgi:hypothetical protein
VANNVIIPAFAAGELSPGLAARVDLAKYHVGAALLDNFFVDYKGGASSRPGTQFIGMSTPGLVGLPGAAWLYKFVFSATQQYVLVFTDRGLQFIRNPGGTVNHPNKANSGFIQSGGGNYVIATPYLPEELPDLKFAQSADVLQITHPNHPRMVLRRLGETNWTLTEPVIGATIRSAGNVQAHISALPADSKDPQNTTYLYTVTTVDANGEESALAASPDTGFGSTISYFALVTGIDMASTPGSITVTWNTVLNAAYYNVYKAIPGYANKVPPFTSSFGFCGIAYGNIFVDSNIIPDFTKAPPLHRDPFSPRQINDITITASSADWPVGGADVHITDPTGSGAVLLAVLDTAEHGALGHIVDVFIANPGQGYTAPVLVGGGGGSSVSATITMGSAAEYPTAVAYNQQRLVVAGTSSRPTGIFGSKTGRYDNFDTSNPINDDDAFTFILSAAEVNTILHMIPMPGGLVLFTNSGIQQLTGGSASAQNPSAITPSAIVVVPQSYFGTNRVRPVIVNKDILYVQDPGTAVHDLAYNLFVNIYEGTDITALSSHLFYPHRIVDWDYQHTPFKIVWAVRDDGALLSLTYLKEQEVIGWAQHHTAAGGLFESVTVIREDNMDAVYFLVNRGGHRYVERLTSRVLSSTASAWCVDAGLNYSGPPTTVLSGLDHLNGYAVAVLGNGAVLGQFLVSGGAITLTAAVSEAVVGIPFTARLQTMQLDLGNEMQTVQGKRKRVAAASIRVRDTAGIKVGTTFATLTPFVPNVSSTDNMTLSGLVTGDMRMIVDPSYNVHGQICVQQDNPLPATILGVIPEVVLGDNGR